MVCGTGFLSVRVAVQWVGKAKAGKYTFHPEWKVVEWRDG